MADEKTDRQGKLIYVPELQVMAACDEQLELLDKEARIRVLDWLDGKHGASIPRKVNIEFSRKDASD